MTTSSYGAFFQIKVFEVTNVPSRSRDLGTSERVATVSV